MSTYDSPDTPTSSRTKQEGGHNVVFDILGTNPKFQKTFASTFYVGGDNTQIIELPYPAFAIRPKITDESLRYGISVVGQYQNGQTVENITLPFCTSVSEFDKASSGWTVYETDQTSMGKLYTLWPETSAAFDGLLTRRIIIKNDSFIEKTPLTITYNAFYTDVVDSDTFRTEDGPAYTRELGKYILEKLDDLDTRTEVTLKNYFGNTAHTKDILNEDLTGENEDNWVEAELHEIDTSTGKNLLAPAKGSFYPGVSVAGKRDTTFKMYSYKIESGMITSDMVANLEKLGWLFIYTVNSVTTFAIATDDTFRNNVAYYVCNKDGDFVQLKRVTAAAKAAETSKTGSYVAGASLDEYRKEYDYELYTSVRIPFDGTKQLDFKINDTSAVITTKKSVILTADNIGKYVNYDGTFVDVGLTTVGEHDGTQELILGQDYVFANVNQAKTERTYTTQPVYDHVKLLCDISTDMSHRVGISYQAFGGQVMPSDVRNIRQDLTNLLSIIAEHKLLTAENLAKSGIIANIVDRLSRMETYHHHYMQVDHVIPLGLCGSGFQWFNIAQLSDANWMNGPNALRDIGTFRVSSRKQGWTYEFNVTVDLNATGDNRFAVKILSAAGTAHIGVDDFALLARKDLVGVRVIWSENSKESSGAILQIGFDCDKYNFDIDTDYDNSDTLTVTNKSGNTSSFELYYNPVETTQSADNYVNVYGREQYRQVINERVTDTTVPYYKHVTEYLYYKTSSEYAVDGTNYYKYNADANAYDQVNLLSNTKFDELDYDVYERTVSHGSWSRVTVASNQLITEGDKLYRVDETASTDTTQCTLPDGITSWSESIDGCKSLTRLLYPDDAGIVVWAGSAPMAYFSPGPGEAGRDLELHFSLIEVVQSFLNLTSIKSVDMVFYDRKEDSYFARNIPLFYDELADRPRLTGEGLFYMPDLCGVMIDLHRYAVEYTSTSTIRSDGEYYQFVNGVCKKYYPEDDVVYQNGNKREGGTAGLTSNDVTNLKRSAGQISNNETFRIYVDGDLFAMNVDVLLGTESFLNQRFDLRQVRIHC